MEIRKMMFDPDMLKLKDDLVKALNAIHHGSPMVRAKGILSAYNAMVKLPEPTLENTKLQNTHLLIEIRDEFFKFEDNPGRSSAFRVIWKFFLWMYELDAYYGDRINWIIERLFSLSGRWIFQPEFKPRITHWREHDEKMALRREEKMKLKAEVKNA
jgi:hypothetical protein